MIKNTDAKDLTQELAKALQTNGHTLASDVQTKMLAYIHMIALWNQAFNLTSIRDLHEMIWLHLIDSLAISPYLHGENIIDVGTGAGLPGIPLAMINPDKKFTLLDSNSKKTRFLTQVILELKIPNIEVLHSRCEDFKPMPGFDSIVSRAFAAIPVMLAKTGHLAAPHGQFIAMKGIKPEQEIQAIPAGFSVLGIHKLVMTGLTAQRHVICIQKDE
jgi:16S rRNA (guanine527-N7)-methyltransferase